MEGPVADAMMEHVDGAMTGRLTIQGAGTKVLWLVEGQMVAASSDSPGEDLGLYLFQVGVIPPESYGAMEAARRMSGQTVEQVLLDQGLLAEADLRSHAARLDARLARAAAEAQSGELTATVEEPPVDLFRRGQSLGEVLGRVDPSGGSQGGFSDPYRSMSPAALKVLLVDHDGHHCQVRRPAPAGISPDEAALFEYIDGVAEGRRLADVLANSRLGKTKTRRFLYGLFCESYIIFDPSLGLLRSHDGDADDLADELERQTEVDLFRRLGLHLTAGPEAVEAAYAAIVPHFDQSSVPGADEDVKGSVRAIRARLDEAFATLSDDGERRAYREEWAGEYRLAFHAEVEFRRGERILFGDGSEGPTDAQEIAGAAARTFGVAHDLRPADPRFVAYLALAQATEANFDSHPARLQRARMSLDRAVALAPESATVQAVAARFHQDFGAAEVAEAFVAKALDLVAEDAAAAPRLKALGVEAGESA